MKKPVSVSMDEALITVLDEACESERRTRSEFVVALIERALSVAQIPAATGPTGEKPKVPEGVKLIDPPAGIDAEDYWNRVRRVHGQGLPWATACRVAAAELGGSRVKDGPTKKPRPTDRVIRSREEQKRLLATFDKVD